MTSSSCHKTCDSITRSISGLESILYSKTHHTNSELIFTIWAEWHLPKILSTNVPTINYNGIVSKTSLVVSFISDYAAIIFGNYSFSDLSTMIPNATYFSAISVISSHKNISIHSLILWLQLTDVCNFFLEEFR